MPSRSTSSSIFVTRLVARFVAGCVGGAGLLAASPAAAHVGAVVAKATFCAPGPVLESPDGQGGTVYSWAPEEADARYRIAWSDGDNDPTGKFSFYYVDHELPTSIFPNQLAMVGKVVLTVDGRSARDVYVSCACGYEDGGAGGCDAGSPTYNCADGGARWCDNHLDWDTRAVPDGVYWIAARNVDPPYDLFNMSPSPVRVSHGAARPPIVILTRPTGLGVGGNLGVHVEAVVVGTPPLSVDLAWGINTATQVNDPLHLIARALPVKPNADNAFTYEWDTSTLKPEQYYLSATVTDGNGKSTFSETRNPISVSHPPDGGAAPADLAVDTGSSDDAQRPGGEGGVVLTRPVKTGCSCALGARRRVGGAPGCALVAGVLAAVLLRLSRRRRRGSQSACTG